MLTISWIETIRKRKYKTRSATKMRRIQNGLEFPAFQINCKIRQNMIL
ncbi:hypothetical protein CLOSTMETH_01480 [[Clostridium] methylpentosum DSM 5476]|uniref:Uncharacterized protein n=1 Tax=[Clostridium] methylpentosum DSM 5476 TaxID=537013 RepID=C0ECB1_9FIRM|nr:hypothetical protein CLOSTMETH_01480 [[Clostridium] methylpentosum DSM 5476]